MAAKKKVKGFKKNQMMMAERMAVSMERAGAILASQTRKASPAAKRRNPALKKVKGKAKTVRKRSARKMAAKRKK